MPVERRAIVAILIAVGLWSGTSLFVRAGHSDALVFTTWRLWFALPPLAAIVGVAVAPDRQRAVLAGGRSAGAVDRSAPRRGRVLRRRAPRPRSPRCGLTRLLDVTLIGSLQPVLIIAFAVAFLGEHVGAHAPRARGRRDRGHDHRRGSRRRGGVVEPVGRRRRRRRVSCSTRVGSSTGASCARASSSTRSRSCSER